MPKIDDLEPVIDREQLFVLYATFCGDVERTAHASGLRAVDVLRVVDELGWTERLKPIIELKKSGKPGDIERAINRALNFSQAHRMRLIVERILHKLAGMTDKELEDYMFTDHAPKTGETFKRLSTRAVADLASAMEKAQAMSYQALTDTTQDRTRRKEQAGDDDGSAAGELHVRIAKAMAEVRAADAPRALLVDAQLKVAENNRIESSKPMSPNDNDNH